MPFHNLGLNISIVRILNAVVAGTSVQTSSALDMEDYDGVLFVVGCGVISASAVTYAKVQQSSDDGGADDYTDVAGTQSTTYTATTDNNKSVVIDVYRPGKRYLKVVVNRATGNAVIDGVWAIRYHGKVKPTAIDATILSREIFNAPAEGTA